MFLSNLSLTSLTIVTIVSGVTLRVIGNGIQRKRRKQDLSSMAKANDGGERYLVSLRALHTQHPDIIPAVPRSVAALEFQGWVAEANRRLEMWAVRHRSAADMALRIQLQKQINDLEEEHLRYGKTRSEQELLEHRHNAEMARLIRDKEQADDEARRIREEAADRASRRTDQIRSKAPDSRSPEQIKLAKLRKLAEDESQAIEDCNGDKDRIEEVRRIFEPARMRILEDR